MSVKERKKRKKKRIENITEKRWHERFPLCAVAQSKFEREITQIKIPMLKRKNEGSMRIDTYREGRQIEQKFRLCLQLHRLFRREFMIWLIVVFYELSAYDLTMKRRVWYVFCRMTNQHQSNK